LDISTARMAAEEDAYVRAKTLWDAAIADLTAEKDRAVLRAAEYAATAATLRRAVRVHLKTCRQDDGSLRDLL
jgi:hypothetical protein